MNYSKIIKITLLIIFTILINWNKFKKTGTKVEPTPSLSLTQSLKNTSNKEASWILALSWSPEFCFEKDREKKQAQCQNPNNTFIVHGLWAETEVKDCQNPYDIPSSAFETGKSVFPSFGLMKHEWKKHGACSGLNANEYFSKAKELFVKTKLKESFNNHKSTIQQKELLNLFQKNYPAITQQSLAFICNGRYLKEIRICLDNDFAVTQCPQKTRSSCREDTIFLR